MNAVQTINMNNFVQIRAVGLEALRNSLGIVGAVRFLQQYDTGYGDYTKEKYTNPDLDEGTLFAQIKNYQ